MPWVKTNDLEIYYEDYGSGDPIIVLHGGLSDHQVWAEQLQPLSDSFRILPIDLRGHGKTGGTDQDRYTIDTYVTDLRAVIDELALDKPVVLGHSFGGMIGYLFAKEYPDRLSALITVGGATPQTFSKREWLIRYGVPKVITPVISNERIMNGIIWVQTKVFSDEETGDVDEIERIRESHDCDVPDLAANERPKIFRAILDYLSTNPSWDFQETPILMMYGENEPMVNNHADFLETALSACHSVEIPDASHNAQVDNPEFIR
ncbi:MAG: alpha/beta fold hydrolase, partial [Halobacteriaceae archaeon]